jgi:NLR family CARD domain-containing protein 3
VSVILQVNTTLRSLSLVNHKFGEESVQLIAKALALNGALTSLSLRGSCIGDRGAIALARALKANTRLTSLNLRRCRVSRVPKRRFA